MTIVNYTADAVGEGCELVMEKNKVVDELTEREMEVVMTVFKSHETGLREATIYPKVK